MLMLILWLVCRRWRVAWLRFLHCARRQRAIRAFPCLALFCHDDFLDCSVCCLVSTESLDCCCLLSIGASSMTAIVTVHALLFVHQGSLKFHYNAPAKDLGGDDVNPDVGAFASVTVVSQRGRWRLMAPADASVWFHHSIVSIFQ